MNTQTVVILNQMFLLIFMNIAKDLIKFRNLSLKESFKEGGLMIFCIMYIYKENLLRYFKKAYKNILSVYGQEFRVLDF